MMIKKKKNQYSVFFLSECVEYVLCRDVIGLAEIVEGTCWFHSAVTSD